EAVRGRDDEELTGGRHARRPAAHRGGELVEAAQVGRARPGVHEPAVAVPHLHEPELRDVARDGRLHGVEALLAERLRELGLRREVALLDEAQDPLLPLGLRRHAPSTSRRSPIPRCASSREIVSGGVSRSAVSPAVPTSTPCSSAACATGPAGRCSSTASRRPAPRTSGRASAKRAPTSRTWARSSSSTASTTAQAAAQATGLPPKVEAWSPGTKPVGAPSRTSRAPTGSPFASPFASVTASGRTPVRCHAKNS